MEYNEDEQMAQVEGWYTDSEGDLFVSADMVEAHELIEAEAICLVHLIEFNIFFTQVMFLFYVHENVSERPLWLQLRDTCVASVWGASHRRSQPLEWKRPKT